MGQSGWRLPDELLRRVRVRCAEEGVRQNAWVEGALEKALGEGPTAGRPAMNREAAGSTPATPAPSRASAKGAFSKARDEEVAGYDAQTTAMERRAKPKAALGKGLVASRPKGT